MADLGTTYIDLSNTEEIIQLEILSETPIEIQPIDGNSISTISPRQYYIHQLSQVDIDNKFIIISDLINVTDKASVLLVVENASFICEYGIDYVIDAGGKISWGNLGLEDKLQINDKIKIYY